MGFPFFSFSRQDKCQRFGEPIFLRFSCSARSPCGMHTNAREPAQNDSTNKYAARDGLAQESSEIGRNYCIRRYSCVRCFEYFNVVAFECVWLWLSSSSV